MKQAITLYQVDAFAEQVFSGNPAAVCVLDRWLADDVLQAIARENNLSETAFIVATENGYQLRWMTPEAEVDLCGHATLAAAHVLYQHLGVNEPQLTFFTRSGELKVERSEQGYAMDFPATVPTPVTPPAELLRGLGMDAKAVLAGFDYLLVLESEAHLRAVNPDFNAWLSLDRRGVIVTAPGEQCDFVSRCFFPKLNVNEDPVTGSAHCQTAPYWAMQFNKQTLMAQQLSARGGRVHCQVQGQRILLSGQAQDYLLGTIWVPLSTTPSAPAVDDHSR
ncbi:isomerase [Bacterioplanes sanyensis]|uniref:Isomerase n=2 Tax=Bacterioplanes sanyensis TaxID=1249553 RepID=A0A222FPT6_9GAMM|nr:isomerase [Bacterioplanes sanyensis]